MANNTSVPNFSCYPVQPAYMADWSLLGGDKKQDFNVCAHKSDTFCGPIGEEIFQLAYKLANADGYVSSNIVDALCDILKACEKANLSGLQVLEDIARSINRDADGDNIVYVSNKFRFKDADKKTYLDLEQACRCLGLPTTIQVVNSRHCMVFEGASERFLYMGRRPLNAVPIGMSYYIPCCDAEDTTSMWQKELSHAAALDFRGDYIKLEFVLPYNDSIKEYLPNMEERWENYYCVTNLERPL